MPRLSKEQKISVVNEYQNNLKLTCADISKKYGVNNSSIRTLLIRRGVKIRSNRSILRRKYDINENYFDQIDTEGKAYFLGLLYADGCNQSYKTITMSLQEEDKHILECFNKELKTNKPLYFVDYSKKHPKWQNQYKIEIANQKLVISLTKLGCVPRKSLTLTFPSEKQVPKKLLRHFLRGMWDGDGHIGKVEKNCTQISLVSSIAFCQSAQNIIENEIGIKFNYFFHKTEGIKVLALGGLIKPHKFLSWIYGDCKFFIKRKYNRFKKIDEAMKNNMQSSSFRKRKKNLLIKLGY